MIIKTQFRWAEHIVRMSDSRIPTMLLYSELAKGKRKQGGQRKRFKDTLKQNLKKASIDVDNWENLTADRPAWRSAVYDGIVNFEKSRCAEAETKRQIRKERATVVVNSHSKHLCSECGKDCHSRIDLFSHRRTHSI